MKSQKIVFNHFFVGIKLGKKYQREVAISYLIVLICSVINARR